MYSYKGRSHLSKAPQLVVVAEEPREAHRPIVAGSLLGEQLKAVVGGHHGVVK